MYTDTPYPKWQQFIDATNTWPENDNENAKDYPFYTLEQDFFDSPHWVYSLFSKPLSFWKGHVYAVKVDHQHKTIQCVGGIEWGFRLSFFHLRPQMITPVVLTSEDWKKDWSFVKTTLKDYESIE